MGQDPGVLWITLGIVPAFSPFRCRPPFRAGFKDPEGPMTPGGRPRRDAPKRDGNGCACRRRRPRRPNGASGKLHGAKPAVRRRRRCPDGGGKYVADRVFRGAIGPAPHRRHRRGGRRRARADGPQPPIHGIPAAGGGALYSSSQAGAGRGRGTGGIRRADRANPETGEKWQFGANVDISRGPTGGIPVDRHEVRTSCAHENRGFTAANDRLSSNALAPEGPG
jgi:hypothetical protein